MLGALGLIFVLGGMMTFGAGWIREELFHQWIVLFVTPLNSILTTHIEHCMQVHTPAHFQEFIYHVQVTEGISSISVITVDGRTAFSSKPDRVNTFDSVFLNVPQKTRNERILIRDVSGAGRARLHQVYAPIQNKPQCWKCHGQDHPVIGYLAYAIQGNIESRSRRILTLYDLMRIIPIILIVAVFTLLVHRFAFQKPFSAILKGVNSIEGGNLDTHIKVFGPGEMGRLAESVNRMAERLRDAQSQLSRMHKQEMDRAGQLATVGELAASVAHELKNPVMGIGNALEIILEENTELKEKEIFEEMRAEVARMAKTIQDLLDFARPREPEFAPVDLHEILRHVARFYKEQFHHESVILTEELSAPAATIYGDEELLKQVFVNLLLNAFQACAPGSGRIGMHSANSADKKLIAIAINDNGKGISAGDIDRIFKPFFTTKHRGTGLGLSVSRSIVEQHGGKVRVQSSVGKGTEFVIEFPLNGEAPVNSEMNNPHSAG